MPESLGQGLAISVPTSAQQSQDTPAVTACSQVSHCVPQPGCGVWGLLATSFRMR